MNAKTPTKVATKTQQSQVLYSNLSIQMLLSPSSSHFARLLLGCPQGVSRASKQDQTCSEFRAVLNSLKSHYNKIPPKLLVDFVPCLLSRTAESLRRCIRVWRQKKGKKFYLAGKREEKTIRGLGSRDRRAGKSDGPRKIPRRYYAPTYRPRRIMVTSCRDFQLPSKWKLHARRFWETKTRPVLIRFVIMPAQLKIVQLWTIFNWLN